MALAGYVVLAAFAIAYVRAVAVMMEGRRREFWGWYAAMLALFVVEVPIAHQDAFVMITYVVVVSLAILGGRSVPIVVGLVLVAMFLPPLVPSWHAPVDVDAAVTIALVGLAMYGFFTIIRANRELTTARAEVARLAAESERSRIARDLHDLLGHSLTTITVKAGLARRLAEVDPDRAAREIGEVEELARRSLADVRAAVAGYRDVTLAGELAAGREVLRAVGIERRPAGVDRRGARRPRRAVRLGRARGRDQRGAPRPRQHVRDRRSARTRLEIVDDGSGGTPPTSVRTARACGACASGSRPRAAR